MTASAIRKVGDLRNEFAFLKYRTTQQQQQQQPNDEAEITVKHNAYWTYCGPLIPSSGGQEAALPDNFYEFAAATFTGSILPTLVPFLQFLNTLILASGLSHYLITIRATTPTDEFDRPRWHTDELFFSDGAKGSLPGIGIGLNSNYGKRRSWLKASGTNWKICTTLLGPSTLFIPQKHQRDARTKQEDARIAASTDHTCISIRCVGCASAADSVREELDAKLESFGIEAPSPEECVLFRVGRESGAMHSEPPMSEDDRGRIFVNVVPGTEAELREFMEKWGMEFPRQWWIGNYVFQPQK